MSYSIRDKQIDILKCMLNFNQPVNVNPNLNEPSWKVLVYDDFGQDIITPLLTVRELRDLGVTAHLLLRSERDLIPDVPAVYFVTPTGENIAQICLDLKNELYESYYMNFISPIPRPLLEDVAQAAIAANCVQQINKVFDQYMNFISLEDDLFCLRHQHNNIMSFYSLNRSDVRDSEMEEIVNAITDGLFAVFVALGSIPIIRCPKGGSAEFIAEKLDKKLRDNLRDTRNGLFLNVDSAAATSGAGAAGGGAGSMSLSFQRPLLVLLDRNFDLATPFHHTWTYQALMHDTLPMKLNSVEITETKQGHMPGTSAASTTTKSYNLMNADKFWRAQKGSPFPVVAESIKEELDKYKQSEQELKSLKHAIGNDEDMNAAGADFLFSSATSKLTGAIDSLPELLERKRLIDQHTNITYALLDQIKARNLDAFFETEERIMSKESLERSIMEMINDPEMGTAEDKLRLFLIYYLCCGANMSPSELDQYVLQLKEAKCDTDCIKFIKRHKSFVKLTAQYGDYSSSVASSKISNLISKSSKFVLEGVKNLVVKQQKLPITKIADNLIELKSSPETDDYRYFDPKLIKSDSARVRTPFNDAIVFVIGGGNYIEYQNLVDNARAKSTPVNQKRVIYGCTDLVNASDLLKQFSRLGREMM